MTFLKIKQRDFLYNNKEQRKETAACQKDITYPPPSRNVIARPQFKYDPVWQIFFKASGFILWATCTQHRNQSNSKSKSDYSMLAAEIERNSRDYIIKNIVWTQELKMTSNFE